MPPIKRLLIVLCLVAASLFAGSAQTKNADEPKPTPTAKALTDDQVKDLIVRDSIAEYQSTGHPCACPYNTARNGSSCGGRSAYSRPGGAAPLCYRKDVTAGMVLDYRSAHPDEAKAKAAN